MRALAAVFVAACWTSPPPLEPPVTPKPIASAHGPRKLPPAKPRSSTELATALGIALRASSSALADLIDDQVVMLDIDTGTVETLCGTAASAAAQRWGVLLSDPARHPALCFAAADQRFMCRQAMSSVEVTVMLDFVHREDGWHLLSGSVGQLDHAHAYSLRAKMDEITAQVAAARCP